MISNATPAASAYARAVEPEPSVTITDATFFGHGWQPLTIATLQAIWFMPQGMSFGVEDLSAWFRQLGWKSANGKPLGVDAVRRELALIRAAGYVQAVRLRGDGGRVEGIRYEVSKRVRSDRELAGPWIPIQPTDPENRRSHHVPSLTAHGDSPEMVDGRNRRSHHVPPFTRPGHSPEMVDAAKLQVAPCASNGVLPPHPPEEVDTSSPYPLTQPAAPGEGEAGHSPEETAAAEQFLQKLPAPWAVGRQTAKRQAPKLLEAVTEQGWQLDDALVAELTKNPGGINNYSAVLKTRIADLPLRTSATTASRPARTYADPTYCGLNGCDYGQIEQPNGRYAPCPCTRKATAA